ncbi:unnamed protein product, partial [Urochloa humidicola]
AGDIWIEFKALYDLYHRDTVHKSLMNIWCMQKIQMCWKKNYHNIGFLDLDVIHERTVEKHSYDVVDQIYRASISRISIHSFFCHTVISEFFITFAIPL